MSAASSATCTAGCLDCGASDSTAPRAASFPSALARSEGRYLLTTHSARQADSCSRPTWARYGTRLGAYGYRHAADPVPRL